MTKKQKETVKIATNFLEELGIDYGTTYGEDDEGNVERLIYIDAKYQDKSIINKKAKINLCVTEDGYCYFEVWDKEEKNDKK